jgi:hypothetical protein
MKKTTESSTILKHSHKYDLPPEALTMNSVLDVEPQDKTSHLLLLLNRGRSSFRRVT